MVWLENHGISSTYAGKIFAKYSSFAIDIMEKDTYRLFQDIDGIGFLTADKIAFNLGVKKDDFKRISQSSAALQTLRKWSLLCSRMTLVTKTAKILQLETNSVHQVLNQRIKDESLNTETIGGELLIYPPYLYYAEKKSSKTIIRTKTKQ